MNPLPFWGHRHNSNFKYYIVHNDRQIIINVMFPENIVVIKNQHTGIIMYFPELYNTKFCLSFTYFRAMCLEFKLSAKDLRFVMSTPQTSHS